MVSFGVADWKERLFTLTSDSDSNLVGVKIGLAAQLKAEGCNVELLVDDAHCLQSSISTVWQHMVEVDQVVRRVSEFFTPKRLRVLVQQVNKLQGQAP